MNTKQIEFVEISKNMFTGKPFFMKQKNWVFIGSNAGIFVFDVKKNNFIEQIDIPYHGSIACSFELTKSIETAYSFNERLLSMFGSKK